jgi:hypothetical protein
MRRAVGLVVVAGLMFIGAQPAWASWAAVPLEMLVDEADLVVQGKVVKTADAGFKIGTRSYDAAIVEVAAVLKNVTGQQAIKQVPIAQPAAGGGLAISTDIRFNVGSVPAAGGRE